MNQLKIILCQFISKGWKFIVFINHKPLTFAFMQNVDKASPYHLDFIGECSTDIRYIKGSEKIVANVLSRVKIDVVSETIVIEYEKMATEQQSDED